MIKLLSIKLSLIALFLFGAIQPKPKLLVIKNPDQSAHLQTHTEWNTVSPSRPVEWNKENLEFLVNTGAIFNKQLVLLTQPQLRRITQASALDLPISIHTPHLPRGPPAGLSLYNQKL